MNHFYHKIHGWFDFEDVYFKAIVHFPENSHFVEVGSWKGKSSAFMAVEILNSGKNIKFDCIDTWDGKGNNGEYDEDIDVINNSLYETFLKNMEPVVGHYTPIRMLSIEASKLYEDESLDFVYIDGSHDYESVKEDILAWIPKVKIGGVIAGHDYDHAGVKQAVDELFTLFGVQGFSWHHLKKNN